MRRLVLLLSLAAAAPAFAQVDRSTPPQPGPPPEVRLPAVQKRALSNGLPVWIVEHHEVPVAQVDLVIRSGTAADPAGRYGVASFAAAMLDEGAGSRDALQIADAVDYLGAELSTGSATDASFVRLHAPVARLADALPVMADVALRPTFPGAELERIRQERLTALQQSRDDPAQIVAAAFPLIVFGPEHRYGTGAIGTTDTLKAMGVADLRAFHATHYQPSNALLIVVGDVSVDEILPLLESQFGSWKAGAGAAPARVAEPPQLGSRRVVIVDKPGAAQSQVRIGWVGVPRSTEDYYALQVLNTILGGSFTSRLNQNLRETHGYAYGARSAFDMRRVAGTFFATAGVQTDKTAESVKEFFTELTNILKPMTPVEIAKGRNYLALSYARDFESTRDIATQLAEMYIYDLPADFFDTYVQKIQGVSVESVQRAARKYIQPDKFAVVIVGDRKQIEAPVKALGLGPIAVMAVPEVVR
jgi:predicted Zn-dependent peptidase